MKYTVTAPVKDFTGDVAGVHLVKGNYTGELTPWALAYFRGAGYGVEALAEHPVPVEPPAGNASQEEWAAYAVAHRGADPDQVRAMKRDDLREKYGSTGPE